MNSCPTHLCPVAMTMTSKRSLTHEAINIRFAIAQYIAISMTALIFMKKEYITAKNSNYICESCVYKAMSQPLLDCT